ncbi:MAG: nucleotide sugar dehydrogenase [Nanoarchaeota archaeon]|nr:nucleotide sugar dehydrogenase [Nanoarchaeota archaeon]
MNRKLCVVGLGYVGLPLAVEFGKKQRLIGFDIKRKKIEELITGHDSMDEVSDEDLKQTDILYTYDPAKIKESDFIIVAVPTPVDEHNIPNLTPVVKASETVGKNMSKGSIVVYESTVYPGVTEEVCAPILEKESGMKCGIDFKIGYSPERVNPGDKDHTIPKIVKVVSGMDEETLDVVAEVYGSIITAGVHRAPSIKAAEAAKVIENTQRDLNIALMNELAIIFGKLGINTTDVLDAAASKWNFHRYTPGLVGGHCIGVDPYYLLWKAEELGYHTQIITAGRRINDDMHKYIAERVLKSLIKKGTKVSGSTVVILGLTFKEDVTDMRNSRVKHLIKELREYDINVIAHDPMLHGNGDIKEEFDIENTPLEKLVSAPVVIMASPHRQFFTEPYRKYYEMLAEENALFFDIKGAFRRERLPEGLSYQTL